MMTVWPPNVAEMFFVLDDENRPVHPSSFEEYCVFLESDRRRVAYTRVSEKVSVSTVFIGFNMALSGPPRVFETMIFGGALQHEQRRYVSFDDAETGHKAAVRRAEAALKAEPLE